MKFLKLLVIPIFAFSFELEFSKKFYHELPHDTLSTYITVTITDDTEIIVGERLEIFNQKIKSFDKVERKLGTFNIRPRYRHSSSTPRISGYIGELRYKINSRKARFMDEFISEIIKLKTNRDTNVSVSNLSWSVKEDTYNVTFDLLRLEAINWVNTYSNNLSKDINKECLVKKIDISKPRQMMLNTQKAVYSNAEASAKTVAVPEANQERLVIEPRFIMECK